MFYILYSPKTQSLHKKINIFYLVSDNIEKASLLKAIVAKKNLMLLKKTVNGAITHWKNGKNKATKYSQVGF